MLHEDLLFILFILFILLSPYNRRRAAGRRQVYPIRRSLARMSRASSA